MIIVRHCEDIFTFRWPWRVRKTEDGGFVAWVPWWGKPIWRLARLLDVKLVMWDRRPREERGERITFISRNEAARL